MRDLAEYQFVIPGACPPKGSRTPNGTKSGRESSARVEPWTKAAVRLMRDRLGKPRASFSGPVYVGLTFVFKRPKVTEFEFPTAPSIGDVDKLCRTVLDALTKADVIEDDRFVVELQGPPRKIWGDDDLTIIRVGQALPGPRPVEPQYLGDDVCSDPTGAACPFDHLDTTSYPGGPPTYLHGKRKDRVVNPFA